MTMDAKYFFVGEGERAIIFTRSCYSILNLHQSRIRQVTDDVKTSCLHYNVINCHNSCPTHITDAYVHTCMPVLLCTFVASHFIITSLYSSAFIDSYSYKFYFDRKLLNNHSNLSLATTNLQLIGVKKVPN